MRMIKTTVIPFYGRISIKGKETQCLVEVSVSVSKEEKTLTIEEQTTGLVFTIQAEEISKALNKEILEEF